MKNLPFTILIIVITLVAIVIFSKKSSQPKLISQPSSKQDQTQTTQTTQAKDVEVIAENLKIPWELVFLPNDEMLVTERPGNLVKIGKDRKTIKIDGVQHRGEGGLLGLALHPKFSDNQLLYLYLTTKDGEGTINRVEQYKLDGDKLTDKKVIIDKIPGAIYHDGGRMKFGPDGMLYVTTGDANNEKNGQNKDTLAAKILRVGDNGSIPADNPFGTAVWSSGHRNPQGLAFDDKDRLWATEHGPTAGFGKSGVDELNLIEKGKNYGWPTITGDEKNEGMVTPALNSGKDETWAPSGAAFFNGKIYFAGLFGETLYEADIAKKPVELKRHLAKQFGRLRTVVVGPDNLLYIMTNNTDGRGTPKDGDDKIIRINPGL